MIRPDFFTFHDTAGTPGFAKSMIPYAQLRYLQILACLEACVDPTPGSDNPVPPLVAPYLFSDFVSQLRRALWPDTCVTANIPLDQQQHVLQLFGHLRRQGVIIKGHDLWFSDEQYFHLSRGGLSRRILTFPITTATPSVGELDAMRWILPITDIIAPRVVSRNDEHFLTLTFSLPTEGAFARLIPIGISQRMEFAANDEPRTNIYLSTYNAECEPQDDSPEVSHDTAN